MINYSVEKLNDNFIDEITQLLDLHWNEVESYTENIPLSPDYDTYRLLDSKGSLHIITVRDNEDLIGYYISFIFNHHHSKDHIFAQNDMLFIHPDYRKGRIGYNMFKFAEDELKKIGCSVIQIHMKTKFPFETLCQRLGMDKHEIVYSKYIGE